MPMTEQAAARRMRMMEELQEDAAGHDLADLAREFGVDERTIRRDVDYLQQLLGTARGLELRRGRVILARASYAPGYFSDQLGQNAGPKQAIARYVVAGLTDNLAIAITAGSTTYHVAQEIRRAVIECERPRNLIAFTNSLPALQELVAAGVSTGVLGDVYNSDDGAFHSHEFQSAFHPSLAIVGASGAVVDTQNAVLDLSSQRAEEAAFLKQLLAPVPEIVVALDGSKLGKRHPWSFTGRAALSGKSVRLVTSNLSPEQRQALEGLTASAPGAGWSFQYHEAE